MIKKSIIILSLFVGGFSHAMIGKSPSSKDLKLPSSEDVNVKLKNPTNCQMRAYAEKNEKTAAEDTIKYGTKKLYLQADASGIAIQSKESGQ